MGREPENHHPASFVPDTLRSVTRFVSERPVVSLVSVAVTACVCVVITVGYIRFKTNRSDLIDPDAPFHQRWLSYTESFGDESDIILTVEADTPVAIKQAIDVLGSRMSRETELFRSVLYKIEPGQLRQKGLQYLSPEQLTEALIRLERYRPVLQGRWDLLEVDSLYTLFHQQLTAQDAAKNTGGVTTLLSQGQMLSESLARFLADRNDFQSPWPEILPVDPRLRDNADEVVYLLNDRGTMGFVKAFPVEQSQDFAGPTRSITRVREIVAEVSRMHPNARIGVTGIPVLEHDEMSKSQQDMVSASIVSFLGVGIILVIGFRGLRHPLLALIMLAVGMCWAFGYTTLAVGHLNILSISFAVILIGLGIDFAIHYLARYLEVRHSGESLQPALLRTSGSVGTGIVAAAITTSLAFYCAMFTNFVGVAELGIIAGGGILLCALAAFTVLPALIVIVDRSVEPKQLPTPFQGDYLRYLTSKSPVVVVLLSSLAIGLCGSQALHWDGGHLQFRVAYDSNLLNLQAEELESVETQRRIFRESDSSLLYAVSVADTAAEARQLRRAFEGLSTVHHVEELGSRLPEFPAEQTQLLIQAMRAELAKVPQYLPHGSSVDPSKIGRSMEQVFQLLQHRDDDSAIRTAAAIDWFLNRFEQLGLTEQIAFVTEYQARAISALVTQFRMLAGAADPDPVTLSDLPVELTSRFVSSEGKWLLQVYPKDQIWDFAPLQSFVEQIRTIDRDVTGTPLQNFEASQQIKESYQRAALYALTVICLVLMIDLLNRKHALAATVIPAAAIFLVGVVCQAQSMPIIPELLVGGFVAMVICSAAILDYRSVRDTFLTVLPPLAGGAIMFGILALTGEPLNPANLIVLPLILGIGVDDGVHVVHDFRMQKQDYKISSSIINGIVLTSLTSMIGFGSMMFAAHRGLSSFGYVLVVGVASCLFVSLVPLPAILTMVSRVGRGQSVRNEEIVSNKPQRADSSARRIEKVPS